MKRLETMSIREMLKLARVKVKRQGPMEIRRLYRPCPDCGHVSTYCAERRFCGERGVQVCTDAVCIACGFEGSVGGVPRPRTAGAGR